MYPATFVAKFWRNVDRSGGDDACWEWQGTPGSSGYGRINHDKREYLSHRLAYELANGTIDPDLQVRHTCDNRPCCNPRHLIQGTTQDNTADRHERRRDAKGIRHGNYGKPLDYFRGEAHPLNKLTADQVREIRGKSHAGYSYADLAGIYGVSKSNISQIVTRKSWAWLDD